MLAKAASRTTPDEPRRTAIHAPPQRPEPPRRPAAPPRRTHAAPAPAACPPPPAPRPPPRRLDTRPEGRYEVAEPDAVRALLTRYRSSLETPQDAALFERVLASGAVPREEAVA